MKTIRFVLVILIGLFLAVIKLSADTIMFQGGGQVSGVILQTNADQILLLARDAAFNFPRSNLKEIKLEPTSQSAETNSERLSDFRAALVLLSKQSWATNLMPIPATVIDKGVLKNVPYSSFRCGEDYEFNVYGDLDHPAGVEIGVYRSLLDSPVAKSNCVEFIRSLLNNPEDKNFLNGLNLKTDYKARNDLSFEITPPTDLDAYNGWWISIYSEQELSHARASDDEMKHISISMAEVANQSDATNNLYVWSKSDLKLARTPKPQTITFVSPSSGELITNAEVVRVVDGVSLIYRNGPTSGGMVRLADLSEELKNRFGYDAVKTEAADARAKREKERLQLEMQAAQEVQQAQVNLSAQYASPYPQYYDFNDYSGGYSGGGSVYVHSYYRKNGTYVHGYYRRR